MKKLFIKSLLLGLSLSLVCGCTNHQNKAPYHDEFIEGEDTLLNEEITEDIYSANYQSIIDRTDEVTPTLTKGAIAKAFSLVSIYLTSIGYDILPVKEVGDDEVKGLCYTSTDYYSKTHRTYIDGVSIKNYDIYYLNGGFINYQVSRNHEVYNLGYTERHFTLQYDIVSTSLDEFYYLDNERLDYAFKGHYVIDRQYVIYELIGDTLCIDNYPLAKENFDLTLGTLYNYDISDYLYIPLKDIQVYETKYAKMVQDIDPERMRTALDDFMESSSGYSEVSSYIIFTSAETIDMMNGVYGQTNSLNGVSLEFLNSIDIDPKTQYLTMNPDGSLSIGEIPTPPAGKTWKDWLIDVVVIAGGLALAQVINVCTAGAGFMVSGMIMGAVGEYFSQAVLCNKSFGEINWGRVAVSALFGAVIGNIPVAKTFTQFAGRFFESAVLGGIEGALMELVSGEDDIQKIVKGAVRGAIFGGMLYTVKNILVHPSVEPYDGTSIKPEVEYIPGNTVVMDESPTLQMVKHFDNIADNGFNISQRIIDTGRKAITSSSTAIMSSTSSAVDISNAAEYVIEMFM